MTSGQKFLNYLKNPVLLRFKVMDICGVNRHLSDEAYLKRAFRAKIGTELNLEEPQSFSEKIQWLKLYDRKPVYTTMVDKYAVKDYVAKRIGEQYIIPTLGVWDHFDEIDFDSLPNQFVLKCTHDSGGLVICRDKNEFNKKAAKKKIEKSLKHNYYWQGREWPYKDVKPRIIAEKYMADNNSSELKDYKLMMFNNELKCSFVCTNRFSKHLNVTFFDSEWKRMPFERKYHVDPNDIEKPARYEEMVEIAKILSEGMIFSRIDLYEIKGRVYFGEITLYPGSGFEDFRPIQWDYELGKWIKLPDKDH